MLIKNTKAAEYFFSNASLKYVYFEAIANSMDAGATKIDVEIDIESFQKHETLQIKITDNGEGFNEKNFGKFCHVLDVDDKQHKGIGRLVFLNYFKETKIESCYSEYQRKFVFNDSFEQESIENKIKNSGSGTVLTFSGYRKGSIKTYDYLSPNKLKDSIMYHFLPRFYSMNLAKRDFQITINLKTQEENLNQDFRSNKVTFNVNELPDLKEREFPDASRLFGSFKLLYSIKQTYSEEQVISAVCADERTMEMKIVSEKELPHGYKMVFLLRSDYFDGKTDNSREKIELEDDALHQIRKVFIKLIAEVIREEIPSIAKDNEKTKSTIQSTYPHLQGYIDDESIGLVDKNTVINEAQTKFFYDQKEILEATDLDDEQYSKSLVFSSRVLTEYILYRQKIINKLKKLDKSNKESEIHNLIVPRNTKYRKGGDVNDIYHNNAWVLDDKYMSYSTVLSDKELEEIYPELNVKGSHKFDETDDGKPDLTLVFSRNPKESPVFDVVIIEFKRLGIQLARKEEVISQLRQRARRLLEFYPNKIQRIWFYGIVDIDRELRVVLKEDRYIKLFSSGEIYYKSQEISINPDTDEMKLADIFILSYQTMLNDAESRNFTFLNILRDGIRQSVDIHTQSNKNTEGDET
jgi:hypothetical protein